MSNGAARWRAAGASRARLGKLIHLHHAPRPGTAEDGDMTPYTQATAEFLGARWARAVDVLGREARSLAHGDLTASERRRSVRRIQVYERIARRAMHDYRAALQRTPPTTAQAS